jgi:hypothetical protein
MSSIANDNKELEREPAAGASRNFQPLTWLLALALLALNLQMMPHPARTLGALVSMLDVRQWSQSTWFLATVTAVAVLTHIRFGHEWKLAWVRRRATASSRRAGTKRRKASDPQKTDETAADYEARLQRDREWRERAKKRMPFS